MTTHLAGRMPHGELDGLFQLAGACTSQTDVEQLERKLKHIAAVFAALLREFRASLPANERKRNLPQMFQSRPPDDWRPIFDTFPDGVPSELQVTGLSQGAAVPGVLRRFQPGNNVTLAQWREGVVDGFDPRASAVASLIVHDKLHAVRQLADGGVELAAFYRLMCHTGGGLSSLLKTNIEAYIWLNQLLLLGGIPWHILREGHNLSFGCAQTVLVDGLSERDPNTARQLAAFRALHELFANYDNRQYRGAAHVQELRRLVTERRLTPDALREYLKQHVFPELYRLTHACLYSQIVHRNGGGAPRHGAPAAHEQLEDPEAADAEWLPVEATVCEVIATVLRQVVAPVEGVKRRALFRAE